MVSQVTISNDALAELRESSIQSMDEESFQARECKRQYAQVLAEMLEAHEWGFAVQRATLASITNDRDGEWAYAYSIPQGLGTPRRVIPNLNGSPTQYSLGPYSFNQDAWRNTYIIEGSKIYSWIADAVIEYGTSDVTPDQMPALFRRALALGMAERMARTLRDSGDMREEIGKRAEIAMQRAMADDLNRQPNRDTVDEVGAVRDGAAIGWPIWPALP